MSNVIERIREAGAKSLIRNPGLPMNECWQGLGVPALVLSHREVLEASREGLLSLDGNKAQIDPKVIAKEKHAVRSAAAQKAAETRQNTPPSRAAIALLRRMGSHWFTPQFWSDADYCKELFQKGAVMRGDFDTPHGRVRRYFRDRAWAIANEGGDLMANSKTGGPAFARPSFRPAHEGLEYSEVCALTNEAQDGMTLRDYFAGQALLGHIANAGVLTDPTIRAEVVNPERAARFAYSYADAMIAAREGN